MELSLELREGYFERLSDLDIPVFDSMAPELDFKGNAVEPPYILLSTQTSSERRTKGCKLYDATLLVDIVTRHLDQPQRKDSELIAAEVEALINPTELPVLEIDNYQILTTDRRSDTDLTMKSTPYYVTRKLMRYEHLIKKL